MGLFDKIKEQAKGLADTAKTAIQTATTPPELTPRQSEIAQKFGYSAKAGEKLLYTSDDVDFMATSNAILLTMADGKKETVAHKSAERFSLYFAKDWKYFRFVGKIGEFKAYDGVLLPADDMRAFCQAWLDNYLSGERAEDGMTIRWFNSKWTMDTKASHLKYLLDEFKEACNYTPPTDMEVIFTGNGLNEIILTNKALLINLDYHPEYDSERYIVLGYENTGLVIQVEKNWEMMHIIAGGGSFADKLDLFPSEAKELVQAFANYWLSNDAHREQMAVIINKVDTGTIALELILKENRNMDCNEHEITGKSDEQFFTHPGAEVFHHLMKPALGMVFAHWEADGFYYPAEADKPSLDDGFVEVEFMDGQTDRLRSGQYISMDEAFDKMRFQGDWKNGGLYYDCELNDANDDYSLFDVTYVEDGVKETIKLSQLRAYF